MSDKTTDWAAQYIDLMLKDNPEDAMPLKYQYFPSRFFRYCSLTKYTMKSLKNSEFWLSAVEDLNDPFEGSMSYDHLASLRLFFRSELFQTNLLRKTGIQINKDDIEKIVANDDPYTAYRHYCGRHGREIDQTSDAHKASALARWQEIRADMNKTIRVCCFTERNDSILMWSHYAHNHTGICLEYDLAGVDQLRYLLQPIYYCDEFFKIGTWEDLTYIKQIMCMLHKSEDWSYEKEWRITGMINNSGKVSKTVAAPKPTAIFLGVRFSQNKASLQRWLHSFAEQKNIPVHQMYQDPGSYKIVTQ